MTATETQVSFDKDKIFVCITGPVACGKTTQAKKLIPRGFSHYDCSKVIKQFAAELSLEASRKFEESSLMGKLITDNLVHAAVKEFLSADLEKGKPIVLSGFPRSIGQADFLHDHFYFRHNYTPLVVIIDGSFDLFWGRIQADKASSEPKREERGDDREEVVRERYDLYRRDIHPIKETLYRKCVPFFDMEGSLSEDELAKQIFEKINRFF